MSYLLLLASLALVPSAGFGATEPNFDKEGYTFTHMDAGVKLYTKMEAGDTEDTVKISVWNDNEQSKQVKLVVGTSYEKDRTVTLDVDGKSRKDSSVSFRHSNGQRVNGSIKAVTDPK